MTQHIVLPTSLNLRAKPRATDDSTVLAVAPMGTVVEEIDADADRAWLRVRIGALEGWMNNRYLLRSETYSGSPWISAAMAEFGVAEVPGAQHNPRIQSYLGMVTSSKASDETSWCSAFAKWSVLQVQAHHNSIPDPKKITAAARSWHTTSWGNDMTPDAPLGSIVVLWRRRSSGEPGFTHADSSGTPQEVLAKGSGGHVGFLASPYRQGDKQISLLGGNQGNRVCKDSYPLGHHYGLLSIRGI